MSEKCRSTSPSAIQVKQWQKTVSIERKLDVIGQTEKCLNELLKYLVIFDSLVSAYVKFVTMLIQLQKVQSQEKCLCIKTTTMLSE